MADQTNHVHPAGGGKFYAFWRGQMVYTPDGHRRYFESEEVAWMFLVQCDEAGRILAPEKDLRVKVINDTYIHCSYILHRASQLVKTGGTPSKNDYEDGRICLHLKLNTPYYLVTNDHGTTDALKETSDLLTRLKDSQFATTLEVCDTDHLKNLV